MIKWRKQDIKDLRTYVRKFNAKITRTEKSNPQLKEFLPKRLNVQEILEQITERKDFNNLKKSVNRFMKKGVENLTTLKNGIVITKWQKRELEIQRGTINRRKKTARTKFGEVPVDRMGTVKQWENKELPAIESIKKEQFGAFVKRVQQESLESYEKNKKETYLANWTQGLFTVFGDKLTLSILEKTENIPRNKLIDAIMHNDALSLDFVYSLTELNDLADRLIDEIELL